MDQAGDFGAGVLAGQVVPVAGQGRGHDALREVFEGGVRRLQVVRAVVLQVRPPRLGPGERVGLVAEQGERRVRVGGASGEAEAGKGVEVRGDLRGQAVRGTGLQAAQAVPRLAQPPGPGRQVGVDLVERLPDLLGRRVGEGADLDQLDGVPGGVAPVYRGVPLGLGQQALAVVDADGLGRYASDSTKAARTRASC
ncbi:hypothetical protein GCM10027258_68380 [Amycolatopsis stemonae]